MADGSSVGWSGADIASLLAQQQYKKLSAGDKIRLEPVVGASKAPCGKRGGGTRKNCIRLYRVDVGANMWSRRASNAGLYMARLK